MQAIPDKDFEKAFQQKFEMFEVEPSSAVWKGIVTELDKGKERKPFPFMQIMAAASILIVLGISLLYFSPQQRVRLQGKTEESVAQEDVQTEEIPAMQKVAKQAEPKEHLTINISGAELNPVLKSSVEPVVQTVAAVQEAPKNTESKVSTTDLQLTRQDNQLPKENKSALASANIPVSSLVNDQSLAPDTGKFLTSRRTRNGAGLLGSVVNYVVGKVDPREDKLIKFSNDDDGDSEISGINLGVLKVKKQNR